MGKRTSQNKEKSQITKLNVNNQRHYTKDPIQHIQIALCNNLDWGQASVMKYLIRWKLKNGIQDLDKAVSYLKCYRYNAEHNFDPKKFKNPEQLEKEGYKL